MDLPAGTVTLLFSDIEGSTRLLDVLGEEYGDVLDTHRTVLRQVWAGHGGIEVDSDGDAFFVAFASPEAAVAAATAAQRSLLAHPWPAGAQVRVRMGLHTGTPHRRDGRYWGHDVHYAARLAAAAHGGQVLLSATTRTSVPTVPVDALGEHVLKDFPVPKELFHLRVDEVGAENFPEPRTVRSGRHVLPVPTTELIGRDAEMAEAEQRLTSTRLLTLLGPGGTGKTRLAIEIGHRRSDDVDRACFVPLESVTDPGEVAPAVLRGLGVPTVVGVLPMQQILDYLHDRRILLILDNVEQVITAAPEISKIAHAGPGVRVVVTSQMSLRVAGESVLRLDPLETPQAPLGTSWTSGELIDLAKVPAVALLLDRAQAAGSPLTVSELNADAIVHLCGQLEGLPLALELAARRLDLMDVDSLSRRLDASIDGLGKGGRDLPDRQRGLRAVLEWSCGILEDEHRDLLGRLSCFAEGFTVDLADGAFGETFDVVDGLLALRDAGLVRRTGDARLALRPPVRRFAAETLLPPGDADDAHRCVARALAGIGSTYERRWFIFEGEGALKLNPEAANVMAALEWTDIRDHAAHADLVASAGWWLADFGSAMTGLEHVTRSLARTQDQRSRARLMQALGVLSAYNLDPTPNLAAADLWHDLGDTAGEVMSLLFGANLLQHCGRRDDAIAAIDRADIVIVAGGGDPELMWTAAMMRLHVTALAGTTELSDTDRRTVADVPAGSWRQFMASTFLADIELSAGRPAAALSLYATALTIAATFGSTINELLQADTIAKCLADVGRLSDAAYVLAVCDLVHHEIALPVSATLAEALDYVRALVPEDVAAAARVRARADGTQKGLAHVAETVNRTEPSATSTR
ncbi:MAG: Tetratricopeptide 4 [Pseudonocardiales bacterium]|nr:Tetratricopeptide 4 [Pseudonocardiales bacterium]